jgi:hypothetical protein
MRTVNVTGGEHITKEAHLGDANQHGQDKDLADETMNIDAHDSIPKQVGMSAASGDLSGNSDERVQDDYPQNAPEKFDQGRNDEPRIP